MGQNFNDITKLMLCHSFCGNKNPLIFSDLFMNCTSRWPSSSGPESICAGQWSFGAYFPQNKLLLAYKLRFDLSCSVISTYSSSSKISLSELMSSSCSTSESGGIISSMTSLLGDQYFRRREDRFLFWGRHNLSVSGGCWIAAYAGLWLSSVAAYCSRGHFWVRTWASEGFFPGGATRGFFQNFSMREAKSGEIVFFPLETKKSTFFAENFKIQGG